MRAAVLKGWDELSVEDVEVPEPGPGEVLLQVRACGLCGTDLKMVHGRSNNVRPPSLPFVLGHEWSEIVALGEVSTSGCSLATGWWQRTMSVVDVVHVSPGSVQPVREDRDSGIQALDTPLRVPSLSSLSDPPRCCTGCLTRSALWKERWSIKDR
jgi:hypothetical protein